MKSKIMLLVATLLLFGTASLASAQKVEKDPNGPLGKDKSKYPVKLLPDLVVSAKWNKAEGELTVTISNICKGKMEKPATIFIFPYTDKSKQSYTVISNGFPALGPGGKYTKVFTSGYIKGAVHMRVVVDYDNKIREASEGNNWWEPVGVPFPEKGGYCDPPYSN
jgi:hypothetical protein